VLQNDAVNTRLMTVDAAIAEGAMALFGEKYGEEVRVVSMGRNTHGAGKPIYSLELCGGTHVSRTGDIGLIKVVSESASAAGVRRVEALAGPAARAYLEEQDRRVQAAAAALKAPASEIVTRIETLMEERRRLEKELAEARKQLAMGGSAKGGDEGISEVNGVKLMARILKGISPNDMKGLVDEGKAKLGSGVVALVGLNDEGRAGLIVGVTSDLTPLQRGGTGARGLRGAGRQGRRRPARHGPGWRSRRLEGRGSPGGGEGSARMIRPRQNRLRGAAAAALLVLGAGSALGCGFENPSNVSFQRGVLNFAFPKALNVSTAVWQAQSAGLLERDGASAANRALLGFRRASDALSAVARKLDAQDSEIPAFSLVMIGPVLWTRFADEGSGLAATPTWTAPLRGTWSW
jgi:hypothetical protein